MKKVFLLFFGLSLSIFAEAQNTTVTTKLPQNHNDEFGGAGTNTGFGVKGGVNFNQFMGSDKDDLDGFKNETTWHAGIYGQFAVKGSRFFSIQPEILFNRKGFKSDGLDVRTDNFEVPLLFVFNFLDNVSFHIGPQAGVLMTVKENGKEVGEASKKQFNNFVYGLAAGAEARISFARIGARYNLGLNDVYKEGRIELDPNGTPVAATKALENIKSGMFQVYLGVGI